MRRTWNPGKTLTFTSLKERDDFENFIAKEFIRLVNLSIDQQRYRSKWVPLSIGYLQYKRDSGLSLNTWEATSKMKRSLTFNKNTRQIDFGGKRYKNGEDILEVARKLEYGDMKTPPRPLFRLVQTYISKNIGFFYHKFRKG